MTRSSQRVVYAGIVRCQAPRPHVHVDGLFQVPGRTGNVAALDPGVQTLGVVLQDLLEALQRGFVLGPHGRGQA